MPTRNALGYITKIGLDEDIHKGASVCNICGKIMPFCWDVVCKKCNGTSCYDHAKLKNGYWYCKNCFSKIFTFDFNVDPGTA